MLLPFQGANGGMAFHLLLSYNLCRYTRYVEACFRRISCISRNVYIRHTRTFYFLNTNFSNCTNAFHKKILRDPRDTWRLVSGVSHVSRGCVCLTRILGIYKNIDFKNKIRGFNFNNMMTQMKLFLCCRYCIEFYLYNKQKEQI